MDPLWLVGGLMLCACWLIYACRTILFNASIRLQFKSSRDDGVLDDRSRLQIRRKVNGSDVTDIQRYKNLYFKIHNLEQYHAEVLPQVAGMLRDMISEALDDAMVRKEGGILDIEFYSSDALRDFIKNDYDECLRRWEEYNSRRESGGRREMYKSREEAIASIRRLAPLRLVDGAWLSRIDSIHIPFSQRRFVRNLWQIFSEELGDGDLNKNHVYVYSDLIRTISGTCPEPHSPFFVGMQSDVEDLAVWKAAVSQLMISLLPEEFLPEILGFNLHFEGVAYDTLLNCRELEELGFDAYYYLLHVSIDNPHSGHTAIALQTVIEYLDHIKQQENSNELQATWNRIRAGYLFSKYLLDSTSPRPISRQDARTCGEKVIRLISDKAKAAQRMHCGSRLMIGGRYIDDWLDEERLRHRSWQTQFLRALSNTRCLVRRGKSGESKFVEEISWGGKMFGSFTSNETAVIKEWIDALPTKSGQSYESFTGRRIDLSAHSPQVESKYWLSAFHGTTPLIDQALKDCTETSFPFSIKFRELYPQRKPDLAKLMPLWFAGLSLLKHFVAIPSKAASKRNCAILRVLRAQQGLEEGEGGVGGLDEATREDRLSMVDIGLTLMQESSVHVLESAGAIMRDKDAEFAREMITLAARPERNAEVLVGLSCAFVDLHRDMIPFVSPHMREALQQIVIREQLGLDEWKADLREPSQARMDLCKAYSVGKMKTSECFYDYV